MAAQAQNSNFKFEAHANSHGTAADAGLPAYPGAKLAKGSDDDSNADFGLSFGESHFRVVVANYSSPDAPERVLAYYRKPLSRFGEVLECSQGKAIGPLTVTRGGLTCKDDKDGGGSGSGLSVSSDHHQLRAGSPHQMRIVSIEDSQPEATRFVLIYFDSPESDKKEAKSK
jgi:hypothetical protein